MSLNTSTTRNDEQEGPMLTSRLPVELYETVFSHIQPSEEDAILSNMLCRRTFIALSTVCWHFRSLIMPRLFEEITIEQVLLPDQGALDMSCLDRSASSTQSFCSALAAGSPYAIQLAQYVQKCVMVTCFVMGAAPDDNDKPQGFYFKALQHMRHVKSFTIQGYACVRGGVSPFEFIPHFPQLASLVVVELEPRSNHFYTSSANIRALQAACTTTAHLELRFGHIRFLDLDLLQPTGQEGLDTVLSFNNLTSVCLSNPFHVPFMRQALERETCQQLEVVEFGRMEDEDHELLTLVEFLNNTSRLTTLRLHTVEDVRIVTPQLEGLLPSSMPSLSVLRCPPAWFRYFLPGRPVREVDCSGSSYHDQDDPSPSLRQEDVPHLLSTKVPVDTFKVDALLYRDYCSYSKGPEAHYAEMSTSSLVLYNYADFLEHASSWRSLDDASPSHKTLTGIMSPMGGTTSDTVTYVRIEYVFKKLDLRRQHAFVSNYIPLAFPRAVRAQVSPWIEWKKSAQGEWTPGVFDERADLDTGNGRDSVWEFKKYVWQGHGVWDREGFLEGLGFGRFAH